MIVVPILVLLLTIAMGVGLVFFLYAVVEVLRVVLLIVVAPFLVKFFADHVGSYLLDLDEKTCLILGLLFTIPVLMVLYINFWFLFIGAIIIFIIYAFGYYLLGENAKALFSFKKWFEARRK